MSLGLAVSALVFAAVTVLLYGMTYYLRRYRIDIRATDSPREGRSSFWQLNVWSRDNYNRRGQQLLPWLALLNVLQVLSGIAFAGFLAREP